MIGLITDEFLSSFFASSFNRESGVTIFEYMHDVLSMCWPILKNADVSFNAGKEMECMKMEFTVFMGYHQDFFLLFYYRIDICYSNDVCLIVLYVWVRWNHNFLSIMWTIFA